MTASSLTDQIVLKQSYLCVGLDSDITKLPVHLKGKPDGVIQFNKAIIDATLPYCVSYKINTAFYESQGLKGWEIMKETLDYIPQTHFTIADAKRGDIGNTSKQYAKAFFEALNFDAITVAPYMGEDSIRPFLEYDNKVTIVLGLTSNIGSNDFQQLLLEEYDESLTMVPHITQGSVEKRLYEHVLERVSTWGTKDNLMFVVGATQATELERIRNIVPDNFLLVPGVGAQGGSLKDVSRYGLNKNIGLLVNASRAIIFASEAEDFAIQAANVAESYQKEMAGYLQMM
ncbi:MAG: orotidine-5'-phosphate decarboxylase [Sphingobacteriia bacterium 24-36-13]|jgi:orotidine-5'-phosphate decarboxylase|uniref:orotidine-5'-phosphate decarboxylase n=1 Tax=Sediminibacterium sp. TaxID=1917865 RepID=UPI000BCE3118|nr:orotidine-5'-phosphate decarboxylase [Sediminibacterium sp.]OYY11677.1 MAG: orotidine-5'-phosphate decarboxylase [Sphingobacteriia bacterium 35-36-14]OYZ53796.1 MAG: orotidine-5'-phosphate decarboxylase [Sphingobacteriia bacterium 24-36-13]OZA65769.1 MAG: orotidine-5'-phosphate decarboxylase [Sphingobacteriia bacterium 39-36-14]HQS24529.1 orotidine-5'-phosphate decarboxylase [Sediminibacterium sp.]HQS34353.1 orotidine-5'-phosphate decarboxylase [Sediminibacterium sp.]